jgi:adenosylcobinamide-phosphate synthase
MHEDLGSTLIILAGAVALDLLVGEYAHAVHPVVWLGKVISAGIYVAPRHGWKRQFLYGMVLTVCVVAVSAGLVYAALGLSMPVAAVHIILAVFFLKASIALRELLRAARRVCQPLREDDILQARREVRALCSRDPSELGPEELLQATIESLAENTSDSWVAPLFYFILFGVPGAAAYRAINTLDAMIGYRGRFEALGKFAARLDDVVNWIPARVTAGLLLLAGTLFRKDVVAGCRILRRDGGKTPSPNAGRPMAVMAGLLGVRLEKRGVYALGDPVQATSIDTVCTAAGLVACAGYLMVGLTAAGVAGVCELASRFAPAASRLAEKLF